MSEILFARLDETLPFSNINITGGAGNFTTGLSYFRSWNGSTVISLSNQDAGAAALASLTVSNSTGAGAFGVGSPALTAIGGVLANRLYIISAAGHDGIIINTLGAKPTNFYNNDVNTARISGTGIVSIFSTQASTANTNGALVVSGGVGIAGRLNVAGIVKIGLETTPAVATTLLTLNNNTANAPMLGSETPLATMIAADGIKPVLLIQEFSNTATQPAVFYAKARGTAAAPTAVTTGTTLGANFAYGWFTSGVGSPAYGQAGGAGFLFAATDNYTATTLGTAIRFYATPTGTATVGAQVSIGASLMVGTTIDGSIGQIIMNNASFLMRNKTAWSNGAAAGAGTLTNAPVAGNPTKWVPIDDNGTTRYMPAW